MKIIEQTDISLILIREKIGLQLSGLEGDFQDIAQKINQILDAEVQMQQPS